MKITIFGCKDTSLFVSRFLKSKGFKINLITISEEIAKKNEVAGFLNLKKFKNIFEDIYLANSYNLKNLNDLDYLKKNIATNIAFTIGWQRLIPLAILNLFKYGVYGMHGSSRDLPYGRGRSPLNWSIIEGRSLFSTNLFRYKDGVDNGPVVGKNTFSIYDCDDIETLHYKNAISMCNLVYKKIFELTNGSLNLEFQQNEQATYYPKREPIDGVIDWRDDIFNIDRLIKAVAPPFNGAFGYFKGKRFKIFRASKFYTDLENHSFLRAQFGEIIDIFPNKKFLVRCSGGVLIIHEYSSIKLKAGEILEKRETPFRKFKRNKYGFFDN